MGKYLIEYIHLVEQKYEQWIEADSAEEAIALAEDGDILDFSKEKEYQGIEIKDVTLLEGVEED